MRIKQLRDRKAGLLTEAKGLTDKEDAGTISADETTRLNAITDKDGDLDQVNASIVREERLMDERRTQGAVAIEGDDDQAEGQNARVFPHAKDAKDDKPKFASFGEQLTAIAKAGMNKGDRSAIDTRLVYEASAGANEAVPSEGGFLVQSDYSTELLNLMHEEGELLSRIRRIPIGPLSNGIKLPAFDESSRANGSRFGGVQVYWANEGDTVAASKPKLRALDMKLNKLMGIAYVTDELLADSTALEAVLKPAFTEEMTFVTEDAVVNGDGSGKPLGFLNSGALVTVAKESAQADTTIVTANILKMWARMPMRTRKNAIWLTNQDIEPQLYGITLGSGTAVQLLYTPPGVNGNDSGFGLLLGRPVIPIEYAATLGTVGDLILFDPQSYVMIDKNGIQTASSMHVRFLYDEMTFRFTFRVDGQPVWNKPVSPYKGSNALSPYVALASRP